MFSSGCVYTAKETNSKVNGKLQDAQFRICGGLPNTSSCTNCTDSVATRERCYEQNFALIRGPNVVYFTEVPRYYPENARKPKLRLRILIKTVSIFQNQ